MWNQFLLILSTAAVLANSAFPDKPTGPGIPSTHPMNPKKPPPRFIGSYKHFPDVGYYKFYKFKVTWGEAWNQCRDDNAHLVVIDSEKELEVVKLIQGAARSKEWSHIGVHDLFLNTYYFTVLNTDFHTSNYNVWIKNEPTNNAAENCVSVFPSGELRDNPCHLTESFICEYPVLES